VERGTSPVPRASRAATALFYSMLADQVSALLLSIIPTGVFRAQWVLLNSCTTDDEREKAMRILLEFHQTWVSPITESFSYGLPSRNALDAIARHAPKGIFEVGAGNGLWAELLRLHGVSVRAIDDGIRHDGCPIRPFGEITGVAPDRAPDSSAHAAVGAGLLLCWSPLELELSTTAGCHDPQPNLTALRVSAGLNLAPVI
jgi:hypothetical protein